MTRRAHEKYLIRGGSGWCLVCIVMARCLCTWAAHCAQSPPGPPATGQAELATGQAGQARALLAMNDFIFMNGLGCCELH